MMTAVERSDDLGMLDLIARLPPQLAPLSAALLRLVRNFDWEALEHLLAGQHR